MPRTRPPYPEEFRREAIRLAQLGDQLQRKLAKSLGISDVTLRHWLKEEKASRGERPGGLSSEELARLRDENATLRMEREILRKVSLAATAAASAGENPRRWSSSGLTPSPLGAIRARRKVWRGDLWCR